MISIIIHFTDACLNRPFVLLAGSTIVLILLIAGSVSLLATIGDDKLPSTLMGGAVQAKGD